MNKIIILFHFVAGASGRLLKLYMMHKRRGSGLYRMHKIQGTGGGREGAPPPPGDPLDARQNKKAYMGRP